MAAQVKARSNKSAFTDFVNCGLDGATLGAIERLVAPDYHDHSFYYPAYARWSLRMPDREHLLAFVSYLAAPDVHLRFTLEDVIEEGEKVGYRVRTEGTIEMPSAGSVAFLGNSESGPNLGGRSHLSTESRVFLSYVGVGMALCRDGLLIENWGIHAVP